MKRRPIKDKVIVKVILRDGFYCWYCGMPLETSCLPILDHQMPHSRGGGDTVENLVCVCVACNSRKRARTVEEFREYLKEHGALSYVHFYGECGRNIPMMVCIQTVVKCPQIGEILQAA